MNPGKKGDKESAKRMSVIFINFEEMKKEMLKDNKVYFYGEMKA